MNGDQMRDINPGLVSQDSRFAAANSVDSLLHQLAGAASVCWDNPSGAGEFDSGLAHDFVMKAQHRLIELLEVTAPVLDTADAPSDFTGELQALCNRYSLENVSDTPDFILAGYINGCLRAFNEATWRRDDFHGFKPWPKSGAS